MLASGIAHEIKNPLVAIKTFAQLLPRRPRRRTVRRGVRADRGARDPAHGAAAGAPCARSPGRATGPASRSTCGSRSPRQQKPCGPPSEEKTIAVAVTTPPAPCVIRGDPRRTRPALPEPLDERPRGDAAARLPADRGERDRDARDRGRPRRGARRADGPDRPCLRTVLHDEAARAPGSGSRSALRSPQTHDAKLKVANQPAGGAVFSVEFPLAAGAPAPVSGVNTVLVVTHDDAPAHKPTRRPRTTTRPSSRRATPRR